MYKDKNISLIIPTRYDSERLNGKVLCDVAGKKTIEWIIERASKSKYIDRIILAITDKEGQYEPILDWSSNYKGIGHELLCLYQGPHDNIIKRCLDAAKYLCVDVIVDISHCCVFFDPYLADLLIERLFEYNADYSANCITRSFPDGFDIQVYTKEIYEKAYMCPSRYNYYTGWNIWHCREEMDPKPRIINLEADSKYYYPLWHLCIDEEEDKTLIEKIIKHFKKIYNQNEMFYYYEIINYLKQNPKLLEINKSVKPTKLLKEKI